MEQDPKGTRRFTPPQKLDTGTLKPLETPDKPTLNFKWSVKFNAGPKSLSFHISLSDKLIVGRADDDAQVDIDLNPFGAPERGVSRRHAAISATTDYLLVTDLDSTNGTRLNGHMLRPNEPYRLDHGDRLSFGILDVRVEFTMVPFHEGIKLAKTGTGSLASLDAAEAEELYSRPILIVEDDRSVANLLNDLLETLNYKSHTVHRVSEAMRFIAEQLPRAVLLDLRMPDYSGLEVCKMLRADMNTRNLPIFVLSGESDPEEIKSVLDAGADVFLSKPVGLNELVQALRKYVGNPKKREEA
jgi:CheY-like chemotaxis protein